MNANPSDASAAVIRPTEVGTVNLLDVITEGRQLPDGYDGWLIRTVRPDFRSSNGYRYPFPGQVAEAPGPIIETHRGECPSDVGDGICAATDWEGMASGSVPAGGTLLLVAYREADVLGRTSHKVRLREFLVVDVLDGGDLVRNRARHANLYSANLYSADLYSANLDSADLSYANLRSANLSSANLYSANLRSADLSYANLRSADLRYANLRSANLSSANLRSANLSYANLRSANLRSAIGLTSGQLRGATTNEWTRLPAGLVVPS